MVPWLDCIINKCTRYVKKHGYIYTIEGRKLTIPKEEAYKSFNYLIQGSASDQTNMAMVLADNAGIDILMTIHDELIIQGDDVDARRCSKMLEGSVKLNLPVVVGFKRQGGDDWSNA